MQVSFFGVSLPTFSLSWHRKGSSQPRHLCRLFILCACLAVTHACVFVPIQAQETAADTTRHQKVFRPQQLIAPTALIAAGAFGVKNGWACKLKHKVHNKMQDMNSNRHLHIDDYLQYLPMTTQLTLGLTGVKARHPLRERIAVTATAYVVKSILVTATKYTVCEQRPNQGVRNSFPSGHTATAFMGAELVREEYGNAWGAGAYVFASGIAFMRLYNERHWLNDLFGGAGMGILSARIGYWLLPAERRLFRWNKRAAQTSVLPTYSPEGHTVGFALVSSF